MKSELDNRLTLKIVDYKIVNTNEILNNISEINNYDMLKEYYDFYKSGNPITSQYEGLDTILNALNKKINDLENKLLNKNTQPSNEFTEEREKLAYIEVELDEAWYLINLFSHGKPLDYNSKLKTYAFLLETLTKMELEFELTETEEYLLGIAVDYIRKNETNTNNIEIEILNRYNAYQEQMENTSKSMNAGAKKKTYSSLPKSPLILNDEGASLTIIIITATLLLGILIAALLLVK